MAESVKGKKFMNELRNSIKKIIQSLTIIFVFCLKFFRVESPNGFPENICSQKFNRIFNIPLFIEFLESNDFI